MKNIWNEGVYKNVRHNVKETLRYLLTRYKKKKIKLTTNKDLKTTVSTSSSNASSTFFFYFSKELKFFNFRIRFLKPQKWKLSFFYQTTNHKLNQTTKGAAGALFSIFNILTEYVDGPLTKICLKKKKSCFDHFYYF